MKEFKELEHSLREELKRTGTRIVNGEFTTYRSIQYEGCLGDFTTEYWTKEQYEEHRKYVEELKKKGTYGKPYIIDLTLKNHPLFDNSNIKTESYTYEILNLGNGR
jgi:uncharacterized protein (UPF0218 family)